MNSGWSWVGEELVDGGETERWNPTESRDVSVFGRIVGDVHSVRAPGELGCASDVEESRRSNEPYGLLSSSSHMLEIWRINGAPCNTRVSIRNGLWLVAEVKCRWSRRSHSRYYGAIDGLGILGEHRRLPYLRNIASLPRYLTQ